MIPGLGQRLLQSVLKKRILRKMCNFLSLKMLQLALALIKTKNRHLLDPLVRKCEFYMGIYSWQLVKRFL